jgi:hypothetical protein
MSFTLSLRAFSIMPTRKNSSVDKLPLAFSYHSSARSDSRFPFLKYTTTTTYSPAIYMHLSQVVRMDELKQKLEARLSL